MWELQERSHEHVDEGAGVEQPPRSVWGGAWTAAVTGRCLALTLEASDLCKVKKTLGAHGLGVAKRTAQGKRSPI
jgi:hypothetical protein